MTFVKGAVMLAVLGAALAAQDATRGGEPARPATERQPVPARSEPADDAERGADMSDDEAVDKLRQAQDDHGRRLGKLKRLEEIYAEAQDEGKLAEVRRLMAAEDLSWGQKMAKAKRLLGEDRFNRLRARLAEGERELTNKERVRKQKDTAMERAKQRAEQAKNRPAAPPAVPKERKEPKDKKEKERAPKEGEPKERGGDAPKDGADHKPAGQRGGRGGGGR